MATTLQKQIAEIRSSWYFLWFYLSFGFPLSSRSAEIKNTPTKPADLSQKITENTSEATLNF